MKISEFNAVSNSKDIIKLFLAFHQDVYTEVISYNKYMVSQGYTKSKSMRKIGELCMKIMEQFKEKSASQVKLK